MNYDATEGQNFITREQDRYVGSIVKEIATGRLVEIVNVTYSPLEGVFTYTGNYFETSEELLLKRKEFSM